MSKYQVKFMKSSFIDIVVEANNEDEAYGKANDELEYQPESAWTDEDTTLTDILLMEDN